VETLEGGANRLAGSDPARIRRAVRDIERSRPRWSPGRVYGRGRAAEAVARVVSSFLARPARLRVNDPVFLPSFFGLVYQIGTPELPQALGLGLATPVHLHHPFRGPDPAVPGSPPDLTTEQHFTRLRLSYALDLALRPGDTHGFLTHVSLGVGLDLATTRFEFTSPPDNEHSPVDHDFAITGGAGVQIGLFDNGENLRANLGIAYQGPAKFNFGHDLSAPSGIVPFYDWPQQVQVGLALYLLDRLPLRICLEFQWTDWRTAAQESRLAGVDSFSPSTATSLGAEYRFDISPSIGLLPRVGVKYYSAPWSHSSKADLPAWGHFQLYLDSRSSSFLSFSIGVGLTWGYAEGTQDTLDLAFDIGGDVPGVALSYTFQFSARGPGRWAGEAPPSRTIR
jgi:opacity protein-like surface antigen